MATSFSDSILGGAYCGLQKDMESNFFRTRRYVGVEDALALIADFPLGFSRWRPSEFHLQ